MAEWTRMQGSRLPPREKIVTSRKPTAIAKTIWHRLLTSSIPLPLNRLMICPMPNVTLEMITADLILFLAMAVNSRPRKITSSKNPTQSIQTTRQTVSAGEQVSAAPFQRFPDARITSGT